MASERLFQPLKVGNLKLSSRVVMAPLTRYRADDQHVPGALAKTYYEQRASTPGTLLITEGTFISPRAGGYKNIPGIWNDAQVSAWKAITDAVHAKGSFIFVQLWALGRVAVADVLAAEGGYKVHAPSAISVDSAQTNAQAPTSLPEPLSEADIQAYLKEYRHAARNAMRAGFDGVELHGANGYLVDQFWQDVSNQRTDAYGGSIEKRARFGLEVVQALVDEIGDSQKVGVRLSPFSTFQGMMMADPIPQFKHVAAELTKFDLAYLHLVESRESGSSADGVYRDATQENDPLIEAWGSKNPVLLAGGMTAEKAKRVASKAYPERDVAIVFGRYFISTPDLVFRIQHGIEPNKWNRATFYQPGPEGYADYPFSEEFLAQSKI